MSSTINPLHFEDFEPHRFEDLVRQLAYRFRNWRTLEATGRLGGDKGIDIRGIEARNNSINHNKVQNEDISTDSHKSALKKLPDGEIFYTQIANFFNAL